MPFVWGTSQIELAPTGRPPWHDPRLPHHKAVQKHHNRAQSNVLTDAEMAWLKTAHPHAYAFHADRRARGIPPHGTRFKGDK